MQQASLFQGYFTYKIKKIHNENTVRVSNQSTFIYKTAFVNFTKITEIAY